MKHLLILIKHAPLTCSLITLVVGVLMYLVFRHELAENEKTLKEYRTLPQHSNAPMKG